MRRWLITTLCLLLTACGGGGGPAATPATAEPSPPSLPVEVTWWHGMAGTNGDAVKALTDKFNTANQGKIHVTATFQGNYDDTLAKLKAGIQSNQVPTMVQVYDIGSRFMIDSKQITPVQSFVDRDHYSVSDLEPNILGYYSINSKLYSMPFNSSMPLLYINKDAFSAAGLDPAKPPATLDEIRAAAQKLTKKDASGQVTQYGFSAAIYGWFLEQWTARADAQYCNSGNGRDSKATKLQVNQAQDVKVVQWWAQMVADGLALNTGRKTSDAQAAFTAGRAAMNLESTGALRGYQAGAKFQVGTGFYPRSESGTAGGPIIGGASNWIMNARPKYEQSAAWTFIKFLNQPDNQAYWHTHTGYFPTGKKALDDPSDVQWRQQYPQFQTAIDQLHQTKLDKATQGCLLGVMPKARQVVEVAIEKSILKQSEPKKALDEAVASIQPDIDQYNQQVP